MSNVGVSVSSEVAPTKQVRKRDGTTLQPFDPDKIKKAVRAAWEEAKAPLDERGLGKVVRSVTDALSDDVVDVETIQDAVETSLMRHKQFPVAKAFILYRQQRAEARQERIGKSPDPLAISDYIHASKYARYLPDQQRREVYEETVARTEQMHIRRFPELEEDIRWAFDRVREKRVLPSMRSLQFSGAAIEQNHNRLFNCSASLIDRPEAFSEALYLLLCGCGVGYSVQFEHIECLPAISRVDPKKIRHHVIDDTIEGWADALKALIQGFLEGVYVEFAYHLIRGAGVPLKTSGGRAPGHVPLKTALERIRRVLEGAQGRKLRSVECHRILCHAADAVLSGGIRRSAMICLFSLEDGEMMQLKTGNWYLTEPWLANANNSVVLKRDEVKKKAFKRIFQMTKEWGEPGFLFVDDYRYLVNPCSEVSFLPVLTVTEEMATRLRATGVHVEPGDARSGWSLCVSGDTSLLTKDGIVRIDEAVGKKISIWNGNEWSEVEPFVTGDDRDLYRVKFGDGSFLDCTSNHKFLVKDRFMKDFAEVETKDLMTFSKYKLHVPRANVQPGTGDRLEGAYEYGFFLGDGHIGDRWTVKDGVESKHHSYTFANLHNKKVDLPLRGTRGPLHKDGERRQQLIRLLDLDLDLAVELKTKDSVPDRIFAADQESILSFVAGWADADGSNANNGIRIYGTEGRIRRLQLLLTKVGVDASVNLMEEKGATTNFGERLVSMWYVQIQDARKIPCHRLTTSNGSTRKGGKGMWQIVRSVEPLPGKHRTYCLEEPSRHTCLFNNVLTRQCNLTETNAAKFKSREDMMVAVKAATIIGTLQASYMTMPYLGWVSEELARRDALLGVSMTGMFDSPEVALDPECQREAAEMAKEWNREYAAKLRIASAARVTVLKPAGTSSLELGGVASGHHPHHARRYIRRVTADELEHVFQAFRAVNPHMCVRKPDGKWVIEFPVEAPPNAIVKEDVRAIPFLEMVKSTQQNWVIPGTARDDGNPGLTNNVSNTVVVRVEEWDDVAEYLWSNREFFTGVSMLPATGDKAYAFAPFEAITTPADESRWNAILANYQPVDYSAMVETDDTTNLKGEVACAGGACAIV